MHFYILATCSLLLHASEAVFVLTPKSCSTAKRNLKYHFWLVMATKETVLAE